jgi:hypothetical protein
VYVIMSSDPRWLSEQSRDHARGGHTLGYGTLTAFEASNRRGNSSEQQHEQVIVDQQHRYSTTTTCTPSLVIHRLLPRTYKAP